MVTVSPRGASSAVPAFCLGPATDGHSIFGFEVTSLRKTGRVTVQGNLSRREAFPGGLGQLERPGQAKDGCGNPMRGWGVG